MSIRWRLRISGICWPRAVSMVSVMVALPGAGARLGGAESLRGPGNKLPQPAVANTESQAASDTLADLSSFFSAATSASWRAPDALHGRYHDFPDTSGSS